MCIGCHYIFNADNVTTTMLLANHCATDKIYIVDRTRCLIEETKKNMVALVE